MRVKFLTFLGISFLRLQDFEWRFFYDLIFVVAYFHFIEINGLNVIKINLQPC